MSGLQVRVVTSSSSAHGLEALIVAVAVFILWNPRVGRITCLRLDRVIADHLARSQRV